MVIGCTKTYTHSIGLSSVFRQWRAKSHCHHLHGYALKVELDFVTRAPDENGWVIDFGGLKDIKWWLEKQFDHKLIVADSDPHKGMFLELQEWDLASVVVIPEVGCENFAQYIMQYIDGWLMSRGYDQVTIRKVTVSEHDGNSGYAEKEMGGY
jgi:6-pyruvoyltetrahydropterin/6-carboxytetrahydropterin synthase